MRTAHLIASRRIRNYLRGATNVIGWPKAHANSSERRRQAKIIGARTPANRQPKKTVPGKAQTEAKKPDGLSALGTPYPDGG